MQIERKIVVHASAQEVVRALKALYPTELHIQALKEKNVLLEVGKGMIILTSTQTASPERAVEPAHLEHLGGGDAA